MNTWIYAIEYNEEKAAKFIYRKYLEWKFPIINFFLFSFFVAGTKLRNNQILKELWLAYNDLTCLDADKIAQLLKTNHYLQLIDISNNNIKVSFHAKLKKTKIVVLFS